MLFFPVKQHLLDPAKMDLEYKDVYVPVGNGQKLHGWLLPEKGELKGVILFFHGNGENISTHIGSVYWLVNYGFRVIAMDYRGYGKSDGAATLDGAMIDIQKSTEYVASNYVSGKPYIVLAQSLGGSMAIYAIAQSPLREKINALIIVSAFSDYHDITRETLAKSWLTWLFQYPLSWTVSNDYRPLEYISKISPIPVFFIHGKSDTIISPDHSRQLYERAVEPKEIRLIEGGHNDLATREEYKQELLKILERIIVN